MEMLREREEREIRERRVEKDKRERRRKEERERKRERERERSKMPGTKPGTMTQGYLFSWPAPISICS